MSRPHRRHHRPTARSRRSAVALVGTLVVGTLFVGVGPTAALGSEPARSAGAISAAGSFSAAGSISAAATADPGDPSDMAGMTADEMARMGTATASPSAGPTSATSASASDDSMAGMSDHDMAGMTGRDAERAALSHGSMTHGSVGGSGGGPDTSTRVTVVTGFALLNVLALISAAVMRRRRAVPNHPDPAARAHRPNPLQTRTNS